MRRWTLALCFLAACGGASVDRQATLDALRAAIAAEVETAADLAEHNRIASDASEGEALQGLRRDEVRQALGFGATCGNRALCRDHGFDADDWVYEVGRRGAMPAGPTLIVGFDTGGRVDGTFVLERSGNVAEPIPDPEG